MSSAPTVRPPKRSPGASSMRLSTPVSGGWWLMVGGEPVATCRGCPGCDSARRPARAYGTLHWLALSIPRNAVSGRLVCAQNQPLAPCYFLRSCSAHTTLTSGAEAIHTIQRQPGHTPGAAGCVSRSCVAAPQPTLSRKPLIQEPIGEMAQSRSGGFSDVGCAGIE
jgi:hypothetical protein